MVRIGLYSSHSPGVLAVANLSLIIFLVLDAGHFHGARFAFVGTGCIANPDRQNDQHDDHDQVLPSQKRVSKGNSATDLVELRWNRCLCVHQQGGRRRRSQRPDTAQPEEGSGAHGAIIDAFDALAHFAA